MRISDRQVISIISGSAIGMGIIYSPRTLVEVMGPNAWMAPVTALFIVLADLVVIAFLRARYPQAAWAEVNDRIVGKYAGKLVTLAYIVYFASVVGIELCLISAVVCTFLLPTTPVIVVKLCLLALGIYAVTGDLSALAIFNELINWFLAVVLLLFLLVIPNWHVINFLPFAHIEIKGLVEGITEMTLSMLGLELLLVIYPYVTRKEGVLKAACIGYVITAAVYLFMVSSVLVVFGQHARYVIWAPMSLLRTVDFPALGRIDFIAFLLWLTITFRPMANFYYASAAITRTWFPSQSLSRLALILAVPALALSMVPANIGEVVWLSGLVSRGGMVVAAVVPILLTLIDVIRHGWRYRNDQAA